MDPSRGSGRGFALPPRPASGYSLFDSLDQNEGECGESERGGGMAFCRLCVVRSGA